MFPCVDRCIRQTLSLIVVSSLTRHYVCKTWICPHGILYCKMAKSFINILKVTKVKVMSLVAWVCYICLDKASVQILKESVKEYWWYDMMEKLVQTFRRKKWLSVSSAFQRSQRSMSWRECVTDVQVKQVSKYWKNPSSNIEDMGWWRNSYKLFDANVHGRTDVRINGRTSSRTVP